MYLVADPWLSFVPHDIPTGQAGDLGQRIFQQPFSWTQVGVDIRGRSRTLRINYRTSHQIRSQADQLLDPESSHVDGNVQDRRAAISIFNGSEPDIRECEDSGSETEQVAVWIEQRRSEGLTPREFGLFVRSEAATPARSLWRICSGDPVSTRPAPDRAGRSHNYLGVASCRSTRSVGCGGWRFQSAPTEADERN